MQKRKRMKLIRQWADKQRARAKARKNLNGPDLLHANPVLETGSYTVVAPDGAVRIFRAHTPREAMYLFNRHHARKYAPHVLKVTCVAEPVRRFTTPIGERYVNTTR